jgi:hypothetical protein
LVAAAAATAATAAAVAAVKAAAAARRAAARAVARAAARAGSTRKQWEVAKAERKKVRADRRAARRVAEDAANDKRWRKEQEEREEEVRRRRASINATVVWHTAPLDRRAHNSQYGESDDWGYPPSPTSVAAELAATHQRMAAWRFKKTVEEVVRRREEELGRGLSVVEVYEVEIEVKRGEL